MSDKGDVENLVGFLAQNTHNDPSFVEKGYEEGFKCLVKLYTANTLYKAFNRILARGDLSEVQNYIGALAHALNAHGHKFIC